jgi:hypothetical protein
MAPQALEITRNRLGNGDPPVRDRLEGESIRRTPYELKIEQNRRMRVRAAYERYAFSSAVI